MFGSFGAMMSEAQLRGSEERSGKDRDPRWDERRRGDSDIDWGDADQEDGGEELTKWSMAWMRCRMDGRYGLDSDISVEAMKAFCERDECKWGETCYHGDIADEERMRLEDQNGKNDSDSEVEEEGSDEEDDMMDKEEAKRIGSLKIAKVTRGRFFRTRSTIVQRWVPSTVAALAQALTRK